MDENQKIWRYMSFSRFLWMLQRKQLWLARADRLEDPWELALTNAEIEYLTRRHPIPHIGDPPQESAAERIKRIA
jgi:hypothetical protein